jgi:hypothetical protein
MHPEQYLGKLRQVFYYLKKLVIFYVGCEKTETKQYIYHHKICNLLGYLSILHILDVPKGFVS